MTLQIILTLGCFFSCSINDIIEVDWGMSLVEEKCMIYYFSGTGNSLYVTKKIAVNFNTTYYKMTSFINDPVSWEDKELIMVYPMYNHSYPLIIQSFLKSFNRLNPLKNLKITIIETYGNAIGISLKKVERLIKSFGGELFAGYGIQMSYNYLEPSGFKIRGMLDSFVIREYSDDQLDTLDLKNNQRINEITLSIKSSKRIIESSDVLIESIVDWLKLRDCTQKNAWAKVAGIQAQKSWDFFDMVKHMDHGFWVNDKCNACGVCTKICPVDNISLEDDSTIYHNNCEQCFACISWCPQEAIEFRQSTMNRKRYHHPEIGLNEMIRMDVE